MAVSRNRQIVRLGAGATVIVALAMGALDVLSAYAQEQTMLPPVLVHPPTPRTGSNDHAGPGANGGANLKDGGDTSFKELNQKLKRKVDEINPTGNNPPLDAGSPDTKIGVVNIPGVQQQYGKNFGNSVVPYRPPPLVYTSPVGPRR